MFQNAPICSMFLILSTALNLLYFLSYFSYFVLAFRNIFPLQYNQENVVFCGLKCLSRHVDPLPSTRAHQSQRDKPQGMHYTCLAKANQNPPTRSIEGCHFQRVSGHRSWYYSIFPVLLQDDYFHNFNSFICIGGFLLRCD